MKKFLFYICFFVYAIRLYAQLPDKVQRPALVVGIVVDQMRWDYLYKYYDRYGDGGFRKMMQEGFNCQTTIINYLPTFTGPGHACIYTGSVPAIHGIAANDWIPKYAAKPVYCVEDNEVTAIGGSLKAGKMSPRRMHTTTIADELKIASKQRSKVFGIGLKDRGSILPAGHSADGAFWFDDSTGNFVTSSYYMNRLPGWLSKFNGERWADTFMNAVWEPLYPLSSYISSNVDDERTEGVLNGEVRPVFPHKTSLMKGKGYNGIRYMPWGNTITINAAIACIDGEQLGRRNATDLLCITLSTTDYAGHNYGPDAVEIEDMYLRLDMELADFLNYLDRQVGQDNYTVFLTSDHGAAHNAGYMAQLRIPAGNETAVDATDRLNEYLKERTGFDSTVIALSNYQVYLNESLITGKKLDREPLKEHVISWLHKQDGVGFVIDMEDIDDAVVPEPIKAMIINGYDNERSGCIQIVMKPGWYSGHGTTGTTHGAWNPYDTHIPLLWYGWGVSKGETYRTVHMTDIAPTLAAMLHIQMPNGCVGNVITELFDRK